MALQSFVVGPKFKGVKMLPPGAHMVSYNAASRTGDFAPTTSFFVHLGPSQVYVRKWNAQQELLLDIHPDEVLTSWSSLASALLSSSITLLHWLDCLKTPGRGDRMVPL